ncbi:MAG: transglutaminase-like domain-containing protein [Gammaproteobacteria bacterium]
MKTRPSLIVVSTALILLLVAVVVIFQLWPLRLQQAVYPLERIVQYSFTVSNTSAHVIPKAVFQTYAPVAQTATQKLIGIESSHEYRLESDTWGNQVLRYELEDLAPFESRIIRIRAELAMAESFNKSTLENRQRFLTAAPFIELTSPKLIKTAASMNDTHGKAGARKIFEWITRTIRDVGYIADDRGALWALENGQGDCTEFMYLYNALARINGIPARGVGGYVYTEDAILKPADYHNWSEVYIDGAWRIVDPQNKNFLGQPSNYIAMRIIADTTKGLLGSSHQYVHSDERLEVRLN